jgi:hypothetical protein
MLTLLFHLHTVVGSAMYVLGGLVRNEFETASVIKFDSTQNTWSEMAPLPES